ncbi:thialysine N-epsilon-acetyltransferase-like [Plodia interpunctella]|uniref:thialysine N-epsilon-acetyltransferase-like n=1 Tax=Plodia interpunctella TaxID=58824 RepID=UPI00236795B7|nr:thialysine N-epsilon-acetyltransferase-like [Plodia interpunctella]XP_053601357.1 thialysine N-epsilon-acetyltransferase-like [Plodia interpunctella]
MSTERFHNDDLTIRDAIKEDMTTVAEMIQELADFENMPEGPKLTVKDLETHGFKSSPPAFRCKIAETTSDQAVLGYALYYPTYSTWEGRSMMLEDLYVRPSERKRGVGKRLFNSVAKEAIKLGSSRLDFHVLEWNPARAFYESKGAVNLTKSEDWCYYRLTGDPLLLAAGKDSDDELQN